MLSNDLSRVRPMTHDKVARLSDAYAFLAQSQAQLSIDRCYIVACNNNYAAAIFLQYIANFYQERDTSGVVTKSFDEWEAATHLTKDQVKRFAARLVQYDFLEILKDGDYFFSYRLDFGTFALWILEKNQQAKLPDLPLFAEPAEVRKPRKAQRHTRSVSKEATTEPTIEEVIDYYRVNCTKQAKNLSGKVKAYEREVEHLCLTYGNLVTLEAIKIAVLNNNKPGRPSARFIAAIAMRLGEEQTQTKARTDAINRGMSQVAETPIVASEDAFAKLRREFKL